MDNQTGFDKDKVVALFTSGPHNLIALGVTVLTIVTLFLPFAEIPQLYLEFALINAANGKITAVCLLLLAISLYGGARALYTRSLGALCSILYVYQCYATYTMLEQDPLIGLLFSAKMLQGSVLVISVLALLLLIVFTVIKGPKVNPKTI